MAKARLERSMTEGSPTKLILSFALPIVIGNLFQQFYTMVDSTIVGRYVGTEALAAVGSTGMITFLILGFFMGMTAGFSVPISQCYGAQDDVGVRKAVGSAALLSVFFTALITALSVGGMNWLLTLLNTPEEIFADAYIYIVLLCGGLATQVLYNMLSTILRALGNSKIPLYFLILSAGMNIILDLVFILVFRMGVAGAAWATVISQGVSGLLCLVYIVKKVPILRMHRGDFRPHAPIVKKQLGIGLPMALQFSITSIGGLMVQSALNSLGTFHIAAFTAAGKIEQLIHQVYSALGTTMATYSAQNIGAGKITRIRQGFRSATIMGAIYSVAIGVVVFFFGSKLTWLFVTDDLDRVVPLVDIYMKAIAPFFLPLMAIYVYRNGVQGLGFGLLPMMGGVVELFARMIVAKISAHFMSYLGICLASPAAWVSAGIFFLVVYAVVIRKIQRAFPEDGTPHLQNSNEK